MVDVAEIRADLIAEQDDLDRLVAGLDEAAWRTPTPSPGWTVADQIGHLTYFDHAAATAIADPERFMTLVGELAEAAANGGDAAIDAVTLGPYRAMRPPELLDAWREGRQALADAAAGLEDARRIPWYGPDMSAKAFLTARLMETWAHGQDIVDALGLERPPTDRLRHIAHLGYLTRGWSYRNRGLTPPETPVRVELSAPSGSTWTFGPADAPDTVRGPAENFCLVVVQRRHVDDTALEATPGARAWLEIAQAFAGPPTDPPPPGSRP